jgi:hypothetical protein
MLALVLVFACSREAGRRSPASRSQSSEEIGSPTPAPPALERSPYVGVRHNPMPRGVRLVGGASFRLGRADYALSHVVAPEGDMVWLDSIVAGSSPSAMIVRATLEVPPLDRDERLFMASCDADGRLDERIVAVVIDEPAATRFTKIRQAWRVDQRHGRFDVIPVTGITCEEPAAGP